MNIIHQIRVLPIVSVILLTITIGGAFAQTPSSNIDLDRGIKLLREDRNKEALDAFKTAVKKNKRDGKARYYLGLVYLKLGDFKKAASSFQSAIKLQPDLAASAHAGCAYALLRWNKLPDAREEAQKALSLEPKNVDALYTMGMIGLRNGDREEALKNADALLAVDPKVAKAYWIRSQAYVRLNGDLPASQPSEPTEERIRRYRLAAEALEEYLKLETDRKEAEFWKDQLDSIKFHVADKTGPNPVYTGRDVTTKVRLLSKPEPAYTTKAKQELITGTVILRCVFTADGAVKHFLVVQSLPDGLTEAAIDAAKQIKFVPATLDGKPVSMFMQLEYNFNLY